MSRLLLTITALGCLISCETRTPKDLSKESIIPRPASITATGSSFRITGSTSIVITEGDSDLEWVGQYLAGLLSESTGFDIDLVDENKGSESIILKIDPEGPIGEEGYELNITEDELTLTATQPAGIFYGIQTVRQLLPAGIESSTPQEGPWEIATGTILDNPRYGYRGAMLDVARHFFSVEDVKRYIDFLAYYKMNVLHLHLSDDQGWRIEIKSWPNLTSHGGSTEVGGGEGGYYTQDNYREIVKYANDRYITIVPEIDMPGHTNAALASYAELNCDNKARELYTGTEVGFSSLCTDKEITYEFIDDVIRELSEMTPGPYFHIGGDESHATKKEDYLYFVERVQSIVNKYGKRMIGWDETGQTQLLPNSVVQFWNSSEYSLQAVAKGAKVIMSPAKKTYMDMKYDSTTSLGYDWAAYIEVDDGYQWDPAEYVDGLTDENILGVEAPLWSETVTNMEEIEYMVFPRLPGYAEIGWTSAVLRDWENYSERLSNHGDRFEAMEIDFYRSELVPWDK